MVEIGNGSNTGISEWMNEFTLCDYKITILKRNWGQSNNFYWKWSIFIMKQNGINQNFQKFTFKPQLAFYACSFAFMMSLMLRQFNYSKRRNLTSFRKIVKNTRELCWKFILHKLTKIWKENQEWNILYIRGYDVTCVKFKTL